MQFQRRDGANHDLQDGTQGEIPSTSCIIGSINGLIQLKGTPRFETTNAARAKVLGHTKIEFTLDLSTLGKSTCDIGTEKRKCHGRCKGTDEVNHEARTSGTVPATLIVIGLLESFANNTGFGLEAGTFIWTLVSPNHTGIKLEMFRH
jgi:hypothetical protein